MCVKRALFGLLLILQPELAASMQLELPAGWKHYNNIRTGVSVQYPAALVSDGPAIDLNDGWTGGAARSPTGAAFSSNDGVEISIYGVKTTGTPYAYLCSSGCAGESYSIKKSNFAVVSGSRGGIIYYRRCQQAQGEFNLHCFALEYPSAKQSAMESVVGRMTKTLR